MHNELVSYIQSNHAADGIEVRAVGPRAVTLAFPPELHDLGNIIGELEMRYNARVDLTAGDRPGIGPTAIVWVRTDDVARESALLPDSDDDDNGRNASSQPSGAANAPKSENCPTPGIFSGFGFGLGAQKCKAGAAVVTILTLLAAAFSIVNNGKALWKSFDEL